MPPRKSFLTGEPLQVMLSSRCSDRIKFRGKSVKLDTLRKALRDELDGMTLAGRPMFKVWMHEHEAITPADRDAWRECLQAARNCHLFLMLYNGRSGWPGTAHPTGGEVGICHAEFKAAFDLNRAKVRSVWLPFTGVVDGPDGRFQAEMRDQGLLGAQVKNGDEALEQLRIAAVAGLLDFARQGAVLSGPVGYHAGAALAWSRLDFETRRREARRVLAEFLDPDAVWPAAASADAEAPMVVYRVDDQDIAFRCDCIPSTMSTAAARERVGQPFLLDHLHIDGLADDTAGPVHLIACHKGVTESQAIKQLGFPDAQIVAGPFGVFVADAHQKIQMVFLAKCRDTNATRERAQSFFRWLAQEGEDQPLVERARARRRIVDAIARER